MAATDMKKYITLAVIVLLSISSGVFASLAFRSEKKGYVNLQKVYDEFQLKKELDEKLIAFQTRNQQALDSLTLGISSLTRKLQTADSEGDKKTLSELGLEYDSRRQDYLNKENSFTQQNSVLTANYMEQIWKQINQYVTEYGKKNGYELIVGGDGKGAVMFASDGIDITSQISTYINKRYKGEQ